MFCENCGNKIDNSHKFCTKCGHSTLLDASKKYATTASQTVIHDDKWWHRLLKVIYILAYIPLPFVLWVFWIENSSSYDYYTSSFTDTTGAALWYSILTLAIYLTIIRLIKVAVLYVAAGRKPEWKKEFKKLF